MSGFNFARQPFENERLPRLVFTLAAVLVLGVTLVHGFFLGRYLVREREALDITVSELEDEIEATDAAIARTEASLAQKQTALGDERTRFLTRIYRHKSFSWTGLFNELEEITPASVRITSISPFEEDGEISVTLSLVGRTLANVLEMVSALEGSRFFATVFPLDEVDLAEVGDGRETGIAATLRLRYVAPPSDEPETADASEDDVSEEEEPEPEEPEPGEAEDAEPVDEEMPTPLPEPEARP